MKHDYIHLKRKFRSCYPLFLLVFVACGLGAANDFALAAEPTADEADGLHARYKQLHSRLENNAFQKPLYLESNESNGEIQADVYAVLDYPHATVVSELKQPARWCDILILHPNTKYCRPASQDASTVLKVNIGKKLDQPLEESYRVDFDYRLIKASRDYLSVFLNAEKGPFGTQNYRFLLEAVPLNDRQTFMHLSYSYAYGTAARLALMAYLKTSGSHKVGFTVIERDKDGEPVYVRGVRGLIERNTMRYQLAIETYFSALSVPPDARPEKRLTEYYAVSERYPRQLHDVERKDYLALKRKELVRQQSEM
jgi:hypothetical protein